MLRISCLILAGLWLVMLPRHISSSERNTIIAKLRKNLVNGSDYDDIPPSNQNATKVEVDLYINSIYNVQASSMDYWVDVFLTQRWVDRRLVYNRSIDRSISLPDSLIGRLWIPDLFFTKAKQGKVQHITDLSRLLKLNPSTGTLLYSQRIQAQLACTMNLVYFPFDHQNCSITLESWKYDSDLVKLSWIPGSFKNKDYENRDVDKKLSGALPSLDVDTFINKSEDCIRDDKNRGSLSCLIFYITFYRNISYYLWDIYIPSTLMVVVTWMSFWIDKKVIQARCGLGSLTMVAISNQINSVKSVLPTTSQVKAADVWLWVCQFYVLAAFLEFGLVNYLGRRGKKKNVETDGGNNSNRKGRSNDSTEEGNVTLKNGIQQESNTVTTDIDQDVVTNNNGAISSNEDISSNGVINSNDIHLQNLSDSSLNDKKSPDVHHSINTHQSGKGDSTSNQSGRSGKYLPRLVTALQNFQKRWQDKRWAERVDHASRYLFPATFIIFAIIYTTFYISRSGYQHYPF